MTLSWEKDMGGPHNWDAPPLALNWPMRVV